MAGLLKTLSAKNTKSKDSAILQRLQPRKVAEPVLKGGQTLTGRIQAAVQIAQKNLGKYKEKYVLLQDEDSVSRYFESILSNGIAAIDTETDSLDPLMGVIAGVCLYTPGQKAAYIPINHISHITRERLQNQVSPEFVGKMLLRAGANVKWVFHNAKFDIRYIKNYLGVRLPCYWDTFLAAKCLNENESAKLKDLHLKYCKSEDKEAYTYESLFSGIPFVYLPVATAYLYAAGDPVKTFELYEFQKQYLSRRILPGCSYVFKNIEIPCLDVIIDMEDLGVAIDFDTVRYLKEKYTPILEERDKAVNQEFAKFEDKIKAYLWLHPDSKLQYPVLASSPSQLAEFFYQVLKCKSVVLPGKKSAQSNGTGVDVLRELPKANPDLGIEALCQAILDFRETSKLINTYIDKLPNTVCPKDLRIHGSYNQYGAATGRFSSSDPN